MYKIKSVSFLLSAFDAKAFPYHPFAEVAFVGRSNVGKSSLINSLLNRKRMAKTSSTPGKTQSINFFLINEQSVLVDLPGYGYAKTAKSVKSTWGKLIESYLATRKQLQIVFLLVDIRHPASKQDIAMKTWLAKQGIKTQMIATKADKVSKGAMLKHLSVLRKSLGMPSSETIVLYSSVKHQGRDELWSCLCQHYGVPEDIF